jgi:hypothetical protein
MAPVPAQRYDLFIKAFERKVAEAQQKIEKLRGLEQIYNVVRDVLERFKLPNATTLNMTSDGVAIGIHGAASDSTETFEPLTKAMGEALVRAGLRTNPEPASRIGGWWHDINHIWRVGEDNRVVTLSIDVPDPDGFRDLDVITVTRQSESYEYELRPRTPVEHGHAHFRTVADGPIMEAV